MKNFKNLAFFVFAIAMIATACKKGGVKPKIGDRIFYDLVVSNDTGVVFDSYTASHRTDEMTIEDPKDIEDPVGRFMMESFLKTGKGDSANYVMSLDTFKTKPRGFENSKTIKFLMKMRNVMTDAEYVATLSGEKLLRYQAEKVQAKFKKRIAPIEKEMESIVPSLVARTAEIEATTIANAKLYEANQLPANVKTLPSGLKILILKEGNGKKSSAGNFAYVTYFGTLKSGKEFDSSLKNERSKGMPMGIVVGQNQVIPAWEQGIAELSEGTQAILFCPYVLAYGDQGSPPAIPAKADLVFYVEIHKATEVNDLIEDMNKIEAEAAKMQPQMPQQMPQQPQK